MTTAPHLTIDLHALAANWKQLSDLSPDSETAAVVKANAYGLGIEEVVPILADAGCNTFFVAMVEEGVRVRKCAPASRVFVLNGIFSDTVSAAIEYELSPVLSTFDQISIWSAMASGRPCAIHVDTGMNRLGLDPNDATDLADNRDLLKKVGATTVMSHLACGDDPDHPMNQSQQEKFATIASQFKGLEQSLANSAAVLTNPVAHLDLTRPGIAIYGGEAVNGVPNPMQPVVTARTRILQIRLAKQGEAVGYGASHILKRDTKIAICSTGYADGFHRASSESGVPLRKQVSNSGHGWVGGMKVSLLGRVSMDLTAFDVTDVPEEDVRQDPWIELFGHNIPIDDAARSCGTIGYELLTGLGNRYLRHLI